MAVASGEFLTTFATAISNSTEFFPEKFSKRSDLVIFFCSQQVQSREIPFYSHSLYFFSQEPVPHILARPSHSDIREWRKYSYFCAESPLVPPHH